MKALALFLIGLVFGATGAFVATGSSDGHDHGAHHDDGHELAQSEWPADRPLPRLSVDLLPDQGSAGIVAITADGFTMGPAAPGTDGHAHVYVNDHKVGRAYGEFLLVKDLPDGPFALRVSLHDHDHAHWTAAGEPIVLEMQVSLP